MFFSFVFNKDERSDKRNQILQKAVTNWLNSEGNTDAAFMVVKYIFFLSPFLLLNIRGPRFEKLIITLILNLNLVHLCIQILCHSQFVIDHPHCLSFCFL